MAHLIHEFGGSWTIAKLQRIAAYLPFFTTEFGGEFRTYYFDGFAGTGLVDRRQPDHTGPVFFELPPRPPVAGSALRALRVDPPFDRYVLVDADEAHCRQLRSLPSRFDLPHLAEPCAVTRRHRGEWQGFSERMNVKKGDANDWVFYLCEAANWEHSRGVFFLDPYGTDVDWQTLETIAQTKAADVWYLFPISAILRMLPRKRLPTTGNMRRLNRLFGEKGWIEKLYHTHERNGIFHPVRVTNRVPWRVVVDYFQRRLVTIFEHTDFKPLPLFTDRGTPLFSLFFMSSIPGNRETYDVVRDILSIPSTARKFRERFEQKRSAKLQ